MTKTRKIWLGILTFLPIVFLIAYLVFFFIFFIGMFEDIQRLENNPNVFPSEFMANFAIMFVLIIVASFMSLGLLIYYIIHANNNAKNDNNKKLMWTLVLIFTSSIGSIVYYFAEILPIKTQDKVTK